MRSACLVLLGLSSGCAAPAAQKMTFAEAQLVKVATASLPQPVAEAAPARRPAPEKRKRKPKQGAAAEARPSLELQAALTAFANRARLNRAGVARGTPMPVAQAANWEGVLLALDSFLARAAKQTSSYDVVRARVTLEAELEMDARRYSRISPELSDRALERINGLGVRMAELRGLKVRPSRARPAFAWPVSPVAVTSLFGRRLHPITLQYRQHSGVDLHADANQLVSAAGTGTVMRAGRAGGHGNMVEILHPDGALTRYSHLAIILVEAGTVIRKGDPVGLAGKTGMATGVHLHFEFWRAGRAVDPLEELGRPEAHNTPLAAL